jgi:Zn-dependent protease
MSTTSNAIVSASHTMSHVIGMSFMMGGLTNYILALFNILPIPGIDGGQIVTRLLCDFSKKVFKFEISKTLVGFVNLSVVVIISGYQVLLLLMDVPFIRNFFLSM